MRENLRAESQFEKDAGPEVVGNKEVKCKIDQGGSKHDAGAAKRRTK